MVKLTDVTVRGAKPKSSRYELAEESGLALRVSPKGSKSWVWRYRIEGRQKRLTIGSYPAMSLSKARAATTLAQDKLACGHDPADNRPTRESVSDLTELYRERHLVRLKSTDEQWRRIQVDVLPELGRLKLVDVTRRRLSDLVHRKAASAPVSANRLRSLLVHLFQCGVDWGLIEHSPAAGLPMPAVESSRATTLSDEQISLVWGAAQAMKDRRIGGIIQLMLLTGQRVTEICGMRRDEIDVANRLWTLPASRTKNGREHVVPLGAEALAIVESAMDTSPFGELFPAASKRQPFVHQHSIGQAWRRMCKRLDLTGINPHDVRRTVATGMGKLGVQPHVIEAVLNHVSGHRAGVAGVYQRHDYLDEKRDALAAWAANLVNSLLGKGKHVT